MNCCEHSYGIIGRQGQFGRHIISVNIEMMEVNGHQKWFIDVTVAVFGEVLGWDRKGFQHLLSSELGMEVGHSFDIVWCGETALKKLFPDYFFFFFAFLILKTKVPQCFPNLGFMKDEGHGLSNHKFIQGFHHWELKLVDFLFKFLYFNIPVVGGVNYVEMESES